MATDIFPLATYGVQGNLQLRDEMRARAIPFSFSLFLCLSRLCFFLRDILALFLFFFFLAFLLAPVSTADNLARATYFMSSRS